MSDFEFRVRTPAGELVLHFDTPEELQKRLDMVGAILAAIDSKGKEIGISAMPEAVQEWARIYSIDSDGLPKLKQFPEDKADIIRLGLFLSSKPLKAKQIAKVTGVKNPLAYMGHKHFVKEADGTFSLDAEGRREVSSKIIPALLSP